MEEIISKYRVRDGSVVTNKLLLCELLRDAVECIETGTYDPEVIRKLKEAANA